jgi:mono/diheme cytochrome c family protein
MAMNREFEFFNLAVVVVVAVAATDLGCSSDANSVSDAPKVNDAKSIDGRPLDAAPDATPDARIDVSVDAAVGSITLSSQGVYANFATRTIPSDAIAYNVNWELWADGATKRRWLILPAAGSAKIDNSNQEHWIFPIGARVVKEFTRTTTVGAVPTLVETRIVERLGATNYSFRTYVWRADGTDADLDIDGATDVNGTGHNVPTAAQCGQCHNGEAGKVLGFSAVELSATTLASLSSNGKLTNPIVDATAFGPTGTPEAIAAVGYLHANCGHCHNSTGQASFTNLFMRLDAAKKTVAEEPVFTTAVGVNANNVGFGPTKRIDISNAGNAAANIANSLTPFRMGRRLPQTGQMPSIASAVVDQNGVDTINAWITQLTP